MSFGLAGTHQAARRNHLGALHVAGELGDVIGRRVDHQFLRRADLDDLAVLHDGDAVGKPDRLVEIMGDEDDRLVQHILQPHQFVLHLAADQRVERRKRLVEEPDLGLGRQAAGNAHPLLLAARQFTRVEMLATAKADQVDHLAGAGLAGGPVHALDAEREGDVFQHVEVRQKREVLEHHAHAMAAQLDQLGVRNRQQVLALELDLAEGRLDQPRHAAHQRGLAGAREPHDDEDLAFADLQVDRARGADKACLLQVCGACLAVAALDEIFGVRTEQLPDIAAGELYGPGVRRGHAPHLNSTVHRSSLGVASTRSRPRSLPERGRLSISRWPYSAQAFHLASLAAIQAAATSSADLPSRSTSPLIALSSSDVSE